MGERVAELEAFADSRRRRGPRRGRPARHGRLEPRARGAAAHVPRRELPRARHDASGGDPRGRERDRPRAHALRLGVEVGRHARDALAHRLLLGADRQARRGVRRDHGSRLRARADGARARLPARVHGRADDRRPLLGALAVRDGAGRADGHRRRAPARERRPHGRRLPPRRRQPRLRARPPVRQRLARRPRQDLHRGHGGRLRALGGAADRRVDGQAGEGARARARRVARRPRPPGARCRRSPTRTRSAASSSAGSSRVAVAGAFLEINPFDQPDVQAAKDKTNEVLATGTEPEVEPQGSVDELLAQANERDYVCVQAFIEPSARERPPRSPTSSASSAAAAGSSSRTATGRATSTRPGQLHKGGPNTGLFLQVVDDPGEEIADSRQAVRLPPLASARRPPATMRRCRSAAAASRESTSRRSRSNATRDDRPRPHGQRDDRAPARARPRREDVRPRRSSRAPPTSLEELKAQLDAPRAFWMMVPAGKITEDDVPGAAGARRARATRSSTAATRTSATRSAATPRRRRRASTSSTPASRAASGGCEVGFCLMVGGDDEPVKRLEPVFTSLAPEDGYAHVGASGAGPLHEDGAQRDRVRPHAGVRRGVRDHGALGVRRRPARDRPASGATAPSSARGCSSCCTRRSRSTATSSTTSRRTSRTPARDGGRSTRRSPRTCRRP